MLDQVEVRPLDYDYLKCLPPGAQRFYELVSFQVYGAIASGRPRAKVLYSDYCRYCPQTRYFDFDHVKKQMYKIHVPHRESGYITKIDYGVTKDQEGQPDWEIFYTPGPKAFIEFRAFTSRHSTSVLPPTKRIIDLPLSHPEAPQQASLDLRSDENPTSAELTRRGITEKKVRELVANLKPGQEPMDQLEYVDQIIAQAPRGKFHNPSGFYVKFIEDNTTVPDTFWSTRKQRLHDEAEHAKNVARAQPDVLEPLLFYILHRANASIYDCAQAAVPKLFVFDEAWRFFRNATTRAYIVEALKTWRKRNAALILATQSSDDMMREEMLSVVSESCFTKIFLANPGMDAASYRETFHLNETEAAQIARLVPKQQFLLKTPNVAKVLKLNCDPYALRIFGNEVGTPQ